MKRYVLFVRIGLMLIALAGLSGHAQAKSKQAAATLRDAIQARTEATVIQQEVQAFDGAVLEIMRKTVAKAEGSVAEAGILLGKERYGDAIASYREAIQLYQQVADSRQLLDKLAQTDRNLSAARMLAEAAAKPEQLLAPKKLQLNAEGYIEAGELSLALAEMDKACQAFEALISTAETSTLDDVVTARTAMLVARDQIRNLPESKPVKPGDNLAELKRRFGLGDRSTETAAATFKPGTLPDLLDRGVKAEQAGAKALEEREYRLARIVFATAEKLYRDAGVLQGKRDGIAAYLESITGVMTLTETMLKTEARFANLERGKQAVADANQALAAHDLDTAKDQLLVAAEQIGSAYAGARWLQTIKKQASPGSETEHDSQPARGQTVKGKSVTGEMPQPAGAFSDEQELWTAALAAADETPVNRLFPSQLTAAKSKAGLAQANLGAALLKEATAMLAAAVGDAIAKENAGKADAIIARLDDAIASKDKFQAEDVLAELESLIQIDPRMAALRERVAAMRGPKKRLVLNLGDNVTMEFVLIRPGSFMMGSENGDGDEKPVHKVTITQPFYIGKYEVTQEQWQAVIGGNSTGKDELKHPKAYVSWNDCQKFVAMLKKKFPNYAFALPMEAQWEYACRAGNTADPANLGEVAWYKDNSGNRTHPVGQKKANAWGLYDMLGNVYEWCADWYDANYYAASPAQDPTGPSLGEMRVLRGIGYDEDASYVRAANRLNNTPANARYFNGVRLMVEVR